MFMLSNVIVSFDHKNFNDYENLKQHKLVYNLSCMASVQ